MGGKDIPLNEPRAARHAAHDFVKSNPRGKKPKTRFRANASLAQSDLLRFVWANL